MSSGAAARSSRFLTAAGYFGFVLIGWNMVLIPSLIRSIEGTFHQADAAFGLLYFVQALMYGTGTLGGGLLTERVGRKAVLATGAAMGAVGLVGEGTAPSWVAFVLLAVAISWGAGVIDSGINGLFLDVFREARGGALNLLHLFFGLGAFLSPFAIGILVSAGVNWRIIVIGTAVGFVALVALLGRADMPAGLHRPEDVRTNHAEINSSERSLIPFVALGCCIGLYVAAEAGVSGWLVKLLSGVPVATATLVLSVFWAGLSLGRLVSRWVAEQLDYFTFTIACLVLSSAVLAAAVVTPWLALAGLFFALTGLFYGPVFPMIMALGGNLYPHRLAALSGGLTTSAVVGGIIYPPLMGVMADRVGLSAMMMGAALLGLPAVLCLTVARSASRRIAIGGRGELVEGEVG